MILGFSTQLNNKPTHFVDKIWSSLIESKKATIEEWHLIYKFLYNRKFPSGFDINYHVKPKLHTLRDDINDRWHAGMMIDYFIYCRQPNMFCFAPRVPVISTQEVFMTYKHSDLIQISIDGRELFGYNERLDFAINDGFDCWEDFFSFFYPKIKAA